MKSSKKSKTESAPQIVPLGEPGLVSVIVPTYNRAYCVTKSIDSALAQSHKHLEVIVIDDGSSDNTKEIILSAYANEPRVRYVYQTNGGVAVARNHGIRLARGEFMALLDSDDIWKPWKTELQVGILMSCPEVGMVWTDMEAVNPDGQLIASRFLREMYAAYRWFPIHESLFSSSGVLPVGMVSLVGKDAGGKVYVGDIFSPMMLGNLVHTSTVLMRRERLAQVGFFPENLRNAGEDYDFHLRTCHKGVVAFADVSSIYYRVGWHDQITVKDFDFFFARGYLKTIRRYIHSDRQRIQLSSVMWKDMMAQAYGWVGGALFDRGRRIAARKFLAMSLRYRVWQFRTFLMLVRASIPRALDLMLLKGYRGLKGMMKLKSTGAEG